MRCLSMSITCFFDVLPDVTLQKGLRRSLPGTHRTRHQAPSIPSNPTPRTAQTTAPTLRSKLLAYFRNIQDNQHYVGWQATIQPGERSDWVIKIFSALVLTQQGLTKQVAVKRSKISRVY